MHCCKSAWFFVVVVFTATIAAPTSPTQTSKWLQLANSQQFQQYNATLLSPEVMPFLSRCYQPSCCKENDAYICSLYFDAVIWAEKMHFNANVTKDVVAKIPSSDVVQFCKELENGIATVSSSAKYKMSNLSESLKDVSCIVVCGDVLTKNARQECSVSLWLLNSVAEYESLLKPEPVVHTAPPAPSVQQEQPAAKLADVKQADTLQEHEISGPKSENAALENQSDSIPKVKSKVDTAPTPAISVKQQVAKQSEKPTTVKQEKTVPQPATKSTPKQENVVPQPADSNTNPKASPPAAVSSKNVEATPTAPGKASTESSPAVVGPDFDKNYDYDPAEQTDESNEPESSMIKADNSDLSQSPKIERIPTNSRDDQDTVIVDRFKEEPGSNFFYYFLFGMFACIVAYVIYNNKSKILALLLEGRRSQSGRGGRRKHTAAYRKLDTNLEEAIMSSAPSGRTSQIIY